MASLQGAAAARGPDVGITPRQAGISAKKEAEERKKAEAMVLRRERQEIKMAAKAKQAAVLHRQREQLRQRADCKQRQRKAAAAANKAAKKKEIDTKSMELREQMAESQEVKKHLLQESRERRRESIELKNGTWSRERAFKKQQREARHKEALITWNRQRVDQVAVEDAAAEEKRVRRLSAQARRRAI